MAISDKEAPAGQTLDTTAARTDLTSRECAKLLGGSIGGLVEMASIEDVRQAVRWWAETDAAWTLFETHKLAKQWPKRESTHVSGPCSNNMHRICAGHCGSPCDCSCHSES